jgi:hypothetical protein
MDARQDGSTGGDVTAALFGLVGVIVGGVLNGGVAYVLERRQERANGIVAARLVSHELGMLSGHFEHLHKLNLAAGLLPVPVTTREWEVHRTVLARVLSPADWEIVHAGYT